MMPTAVIIAMAVESAPTRTEVDAGRPQGCARQASLPRREACQEVWKKATSEYVRMQGLSAPMQPPAGSRRDSPAMACRRPQEREKPRLRPNRAEQPSISLCLFGRAQIG